MHLAADSVDTPRNTALRGSAVVYTSRDVPAGPTDAEADTTGQDFSNAAV
jgi:hypothetical protein